MSGVLAGLSKRERMMLGAAAAVALGIGVPGLLFPPEVPKGAHSLGELQTERRSVQAQLAAARREIDDLHERIQPQLSPGDSRTLVRRMVLATQGAARTAGLPVGDVKPLPPEGTAGLEKVPLQVTTSAPFARAVRFLYELERPTAPFRLESARMSTAGDRNDRIDLELRLVGYVAGEKETNDAGI